MDNLEEIITNTCARIQSEFSYQPAMDAYYNISATSALIYGLLTLIVNIRVYTVILKNCKKKAFSSSFFIVFIIANIVDYIWWASNQLKDHFGLAPSLHFMLDWIPTRSNFIVSFWFFLLTYFGYVDMLIVVLVSFNRFVSIVYFHIEDKIWKKAFPIGLAIAFLLPLTFSWQVWFVTVIKCNLEDHHFYVNPIFSIGFDNNNFNFAKFIVPFCFGIVDCFLNVATVVSVLRQRRNISQNKKGSKNSNAVQGPELKLLIISMMMFLSQCTFSIINLLFYLTIGLHIPIPMSISLLFEVSRYVTDFICLSPSWILLIICKPLRMQVISIYFNTGFRSGGGITTKVSALNTLHVNVNKPPP